MSLVHFSDEKIAKIPIWGRVAFAVRCARQVFPIYEEFYPRALREDPDIAEDVLAFVDRCAVSARFVEGDEGLLGRLIREQVFVHNAEVTGYRSKHWDEGGPHGVLNCVHHALFCAAAASGKFPGLTRNDADVQEETCTYANSAAMDAGTAANLMRDLMYLGADHKDHPICNAIRQDFETLRSAAMSQHWTDATPVPQSVFGPLWACTEPWGYLRHTTITGNHPGPGREKHREIRRQRVIEDYERGATLVFTQASDLQAERIGEDRAIVLCERHNALNRSAAIIDAILCLQRTGDAQPLNAIRNVIHHYGAFLMHYDTAEVARRLQNREHWVITEARGRQMYRERPRFNKIVDAADCQCELPTDSEKAPLVVKLPEPDKQDFCYDEEIVREIREQPGIAGCVADICAEDDVAHLRFAGETRNAAFTLIREHNRNRKVKVRYLAAEIFDIKGVQFPNAEPILLSDLGQGRIGNLASIAMHEHSRRHPAVLAWKLASGPGRNVTVTVPDPVVERYQLETTSCELLVEWYVMVHRLAVDE